MNNIINSANKIVENHIVRIVSRDIRSKIMLFKMLGIPSLIANEKINIYINKVFGKYKLNNEMIEKVIERIEKKI